MKKRILIAVLTVIAALVLMQFHFSLFFLTLLCGFAVAFALK